ncbi:S1 RNA-binding domain-containing protein [Candidatus Dependentiae bacterium]|nr:S1 RNA-binding domain-containing protein [Candidatus Dependentiae bacterium]
MKKEKSKYYSIIFDNKPLKVRLIDYNGTSDYTIELSFGNTIVNCNLVIGNKLKKTGEHSSPIKLFYSERFYSFGAIPTNFHKREDSKTPREIQLTDFFTECAITSLNKIIDTEIIISLLLVSFEEGCSPELPASVGLSMLISFVSYFNSNNFAALRLAEIEGRYIKNPDIDIAQYSNLDLLIACSETLIINMICSVKESSTTYIIGAAGYIKSAIEPLIDFQKKIIEDWKNLPDITVPLSKIEYIDLDSDIIKSFNETNKNEINILISSFDKPEINILEILNMMNEMVSTGVENGNISNYALKKYLYELIGENIKRNLLEKHIRLDSRQFNEFREIECTSGILPSVHGSGIFKFGKTSVMSVVTLGTINKSRWLFGIEGYKRQTLTNSIYVYPFSTGKIDANIKYNKFEDTLNIYLDSVLKNVMPGLSELPYLKRIIYEMISTDGGTISAAINSSNLAFKDAGIKIKSEFASVDSSLFFSDKLNDFFVLTDSLMIERVCSDAEINVAGTLNGLIGIMFKSRKKGVTLHQLEKILHHQNEVLSYIISKIKETVPECKPQLNSRVPETRILQVNPDKIGLIAGRNFCNVNEIKKNTNCDITIEDDGIIVISTKNKFSNIEAARLKIIEISGQIEWRNSDKTENKFRNMFSKFKKESKYQEPSRQIDYKVGDIVNATVIKLVPFGIFVEAEFGAKGPVYLSELGTGFCTKPEELVKIGDLIKVVITEIDGFNYKFSQKKYLERPASK